jgi:hypothetical protein
MYYQDTDSFFIEADELPKLEEEYKKMYGRDLVGEEMGQFHSDFSTRDGRDDVKYASESLFIRKKLYCCKLLMKDGSYNITFRCKGIPPKAMEVTAQMRYPQMSLDDAIWQTYLDIYNGETISVDLSDGGPLFKYNKNCSVFSEESMTRRVQK